jgi:hypothetical protein
LVNSSFVAQTNAVSITEAPALTQQVRLRIYQHFADTAFPPVVEQLMAEFGLSRAEVVRTLDELAAARHVALVPGTSRILMAWPFSAVATPFVARANGQRYFANCSWDAIALHALLGSDVAVESACHHCARPINVDLAAGQVTRVEPATSVVFFALPPSQWWTDIVNTCSNTMVFFCSTDHRDASELCAAADQTATLSPDQALALSGPLYSRRLSIDFERPTREELMQTFESAGLSGPYWSL